MRIFLIVGALIATLSLIPSCSSSASAADQLVGTWTLDAEAMKQSDDYKNASDAEKQMMEGMLSAMKMEITFTKTDVTMSMDMMGQKQSETKPYSVKSEDGNTLVLTSKDDAGQDDEVTVVVGADKLTFQQEGQSFELKRKP